MQTDKTISITMIVEVRGHQVLTYIVMINDLHIYGQDFNSNYTHI